MAPKILTHAYLEELNREIPATRKCLERLTVESLDFKPHETSMEMRYLALLTAEIPFWIVFMLEKGELDFADYPRFEFKTIKELTDHFEDCAQKAQRALEKADDALLENKFTLKRDGNELYTAPLKADIPTTLNHWTHHRGQLTVYMRMCEIAIPSIYGPSGDERTF